MTPPALYWITATLLVAIGLHGLLVRRHLFRKILALNVLGNGIFALLVATAARSVPPDPVPHAMVLTGIVVAVSTTAFALALLGRLRRETGTNALPEEAPDQR
ncbi:sodium:proton antiporter [Vulgatibacter sp.]|uniref:sodium:proton antiporter n=1 Tax=Vulgatibacter sp. TaxID=1971226 RepID=UPI003564F628